MEIARKIRSIIIVVMVAVLTFLIFYYASMNQQNSEFKKSEFKKIVINSQSGDIEFKVEIADDPIERSEGLMYRKSLAEDKGMLFIFEKVDYVNFWMKNTLILLDVIFIDQNNKIAHIASDVKPCPDGVLQCPLYPSELPVKYALEINAGLAKKYGLKNGDLVELNL